MALTNSQGAGGINAILGPTNTGKTYRAVERMLEWNTGMIGLPLRLLAREVYDRVTTIVGENRVALVTGEEKRIPPQPDYWLCTVEAMPIDREVEFLAVDEIQLATHLERGHVFTDRLLNARGTHETWFMGSDSMHRLIEQLVPTAHFKRYPRFSQLRDKGRSTTGQLVPRTAVIAFSASQVYELAGRIRQKKGGAAVVLGSLSPRTRNAQVALFQSGEVDYMVATDAIGMGLNMDIEHVAFADIKKFDGHETRFLEPIELAQIAGRAGRYMNDGTFGTLAPLPQLSKPVVFAIEQHRFPQENRLIWRNSDLDMSSIDALIASLKERPRLPQLRPVERADDFGALLYLVELPEVRKRVTSPREVELLWDVCRIPDYGGIMVEHHAKFLYDIFIQLTGRKERLDSEWIERSVARIDDLEGSIDTLLMRIEQIRTWTYISYHTGWVQGAKRWQERTLDIEDRLSDVLHQHLVERFVEKRGSGVSRVGKRTRRGPVMTLSEPTLIDSPFRRLLDAQLKLSPAPDSQQRPDTSWVQPLIEAPYSHFQLDDKGRIATSDKPLAQMIQGPDALRPQIRLLVSDNIGAGARLQLERRLVAWTRDLVDDLLSPLGGQSLQKLSAAGKGLIYQLEQQFGTVLTKSAREQIDSLTNEDKKLLRRIDVCFGKRVVYIRELLKPGRVRQRIALCSAYIGRQNLVPGFINTTVSIERISNIGEQTYLSIGFPVIGPRAIRADFVERIDKRLYAAAKNGPFELPNELSNWLGCSLDKLTAIVRAFGFRELADGRYEKRRSRRET
jgi:ATP-dependent RNA helicase SUPV3L1/SUV3